MYIFCHFVVINMSGKLHFATLIIDKNPPVTGMNLLWNELLLIYKGNMSHISNNSIELTKFNVVENSINLTQIWSPIPSNLSHPNCNAQNRDAQAEYLAIVKTALRNSIKNIDFVDHVQMRRVHGDLMNEVSYKAKYISNKYNVRINP